MAQIRACCCAYTQTRSLDPDLQPSVWACSNPSDSGRCHPVSRGHRYGFLPSSVILQRFVVLQMEQAIMRVALPHSSGLSESMEATPVTQQVGQTGLNGVTSAASSTKTCAITVDCRPGMRMGSPQTVGLVVPSRIADDITHNSHTSNLQPEALPQRLSNAHPDRRCLTFPRHIRAMLSFALYIASTRSQKLSGTWRRYCCAFLIFVPQPAPRLAPSMLATTFQQAHIPAKHLHTSYNRAAVQEGRKAS